MTRFARASASTNFNPLLSFVMTGRDDDYMPDFRYRLRATLEFLCRSAAAIGRLHDIEVLVVDWGSSPPLTETLRFSADVAEAVRFIHVPRAVTESVQGGRWSFHTSAAPNVGLRRARGRFLMVTAADQLLPESALASTLAVLEGRLGDLVDPTQAFFMIPRRHVPWSFVNRQPSVDEWRRYVLFGAPNLPPAFHIGSVCSGMAGLMMSRERWLELRGFDESMGGWGANDVEFGIRVTRDLPYIDLSATGTYFLHMEHPPEGGRRAVLGDANRTNVEQHRAATIVNDEDWGLADVDLERQAPEVAGDQVAASGAPAPSGAATNGADSNEEFVASLRTRIARAGLSTVKLDDLDALAFLAHHSRTWPRTFVEIGAGEADTAFIVAAGSPGVEVYLIDTWEAQRWRRSPAQIADDLKHRAMHRGYVRFVNTHPVEALRRLAETSTGPWTIDLAFVRASKVQDGLRPVLDGILRALAPDGGIVLLGTPCPDDWNAFIAAAGTRGNLLISTCDRHATSYVRFQPGMDGKSGQKTIHECPTRELDELRELWDPRPPLREALRRRGRNFGRRIARRLSR